MIVEVGKNLFLIFFPESEIKNSKWWPIWKESTEKSFLKNARLAFSILSISYILHFFFVDTPLGLPQQNDAWFYYRFGLAAFNFLALGLSLFKKVNHSVLLGLFVVDGLLVCYFQSKSMLWYPGVPYFWGILFAILFPIFLNSYNLTAVFYASVLLAVQFSNLQQANVNVSLVWGAYAVALFVVIFIRNNRKHEIASFLASYQMLSLQEKIIDTQKTLNEQVQAFLPRKIKERLNDEINNNQKNVIQAIDEILRPVEKNIVALFSDIRGYTQSSKNIEFLSQSAIPNIKTMTEIVESKGGIPRLIGDLIFSYFDEAESNRNVYNSFKAAVEIIYENHSQNDGKVDSMKVQRYVLLDTGNAYVGNIGAISSAREITALGTCVNKLNRIDMWTKELEIKGELGYSAIVLTSEFHEKLAQVFPALRLEKIDLKSQSIKDFPEVKFLYLFKGDSMFKDAHQRTEAA